MMLGQRSRGACWNCRKKRRRCDRRRPFCLACEASNVVCGGYELQLTEFQPKGVYDGQMVYKLVAAPYSGSRMETSSDRPRRRERIRRAAAFLDGATKDLIPSAVLSHCDTSPLPESNSEDVEHEADLCGGDISYDPPMNAPTPPDTDGCWLDVNPHSISGKHKPSTVTSMEDQGVPALFDAMNGPTPNIDCAREFLNAATPMAQGVPQWHTDNLRTSTPEAGSSSSTEAMVLGILTPPHGSSSSLFGPFDSYLYSYFFNVLTPCLYLASQERNPYRLLYSSLASSFAPLRAAILVASARHMSGVGQLPAEVVSLYRDALRVSFAESLKRYHDTEALAATLLLKIHSDFIGDGTRVWIAILPKARKLLLNQAAARTMPRRNSPLFAFLSLHFNWMAAVGQAMEGGDQRPRDGERLSLIENNDCPEKESSTAHTQWFCNSPDYGALKLLTDLTSLYRKVSLARASMQHFDSIQQLSADIADLLLRIHLWQPSPSATADAFAADESKVNEIWRQGLLCYFYADLCALPSSSERIQACVVRGIAALRELSWMHSIVFPTFMIGIHALTEQDRVVFETSYRDMNESLHFSTPMSIVHLLKQVWADLDENESGRCDWRKLMVESQIQINLAF